MLSCLQRDDGDSILFLRELRICQLLPRFGGLLYMKQLDVHEGSVFKEPSLVRANRARILHQWE